ncbi:hypothetical protein GGS21DRAFT_491744 [Xylaria nigripes]|nr:hypothetical protein GGS21DRAFT_491744 [Xylaria nigripes]
MACKAASKETFLGIRTGACATKLACQYGILSVGSCIRSVFAARCIAKMTMVIAPRDCFIRLRELDIDVKCPHILRHFRFYHFFGLFAFVARWRATEMSHQ